MVDIIESAQRIKIPDALFSDGYSARFFATLTKIDKYIKFNNEVEKHA